MELKSMSNISKMLMEDLKQMRLENPRNEITYEWGHEALCQLGLDEIVKEKIKVNKPRKINLRVWE
jgi:hypothetical protein